MFNLKLYHSLSKKINLRELYLRKNILTAQTQCLSSVDLARNYNENRLTSKPKNRTLGVNKTNISQNLQINPDNEFMLHLKDDPDTFGDASKEEVIHESDILEEKHFTEQVSSSQKLRTKQYADIIKKYIKQRKIQEAIDVLEIRMLKEDKVKPEAYIYNLLLGACGRIGYTKKAFMLYNQMKKRGLKVMGGTYTALFNACANSPWPETDGLTRAKHLHELMIEKGYEPNDTNYNAMIKAFGRCGDINTAFTLVDEMKNKRMFIKDDTINFLLQACISNKEAGFRHALLVWRKLVNKRIQPSLYTFNLMLRCIRDCGLGDVEVTKEVIAKLVDGRQENVKLLTDSIRLDGDENVLEVENKEKRPNTLEVCTRKNSNKLILRNSPSSVFLTKTVENDTCISFSSDVEKHRFPENQLIDVRPNLMAPVPHLGNIVSLSEVNKPEDRLILVGGCNGFLEQMQNYKCAPDIKTFTQLLDCIPNTSAAEKELLLALKKNQLRPDIDFYNMLIKKRSMRFDYEGAKEVLMTMKQRKLRPDLITYGVLALGCTTKEEALELIHEMKLASYSLNAEILGAMLHQACFQENFSYITEIMQTTLKENVQPNKKFMEHLKKFHRHCRGKLYENGKKRNSNSDPEKFTQSQEKAFYAWKKEYKNWLQNIQIDESEDAHPWQQYRQYSETDTKDNIKDSARFKPRHISRFRVKTSTKQRY